MTPELVGILAYILVQIAIGAWIYRRIATDDDYFLGGRSLGYTMATFSIFATWFGAETCLGTAGEVYSNGLAGSRVDPFGYVICLILAGILLSFKLRNSGATTYADIFRKRYGVTVERVAAIIMIPTSILWAGAQIRAFGQVIEASSDLTTFTALTIAAGAVTCYTVLGGLLADAVTDLLQGIVMIIGLVVVFFIVIGQHGGLDSAIASVDPDRLRFHLPDESLLGQIDIWMVPILGSFISQELAARVMSSRTPTIARNSTLMAGGVYLVIGVIPLLLGLFGSGMVENLEDPEQFLPMLAKTHLSPIFYVLFVGAIVSAILSTVDSALLAAGSLASHNLFHMVGKEADEKRKVRVARICVVVSGLIAYLVALGSDSIYEIVEISSSLGGSGVLVIALFALFTKFGSGAAALASLIAGVASLFLGEHLFELEAPFLVSVLISFVTFVGVELLSRALGTGREIPKSA